MTELLTRWAVRHGVSHVALAELVDMFAGEGVEAVSGNPNHGSEAWVTSQVRLEASNADVYLTRNNVGASQDKSGRLIRYGLANESKQMNQRIKSGDLIGIRPVLITPELVGHTIGQFVSREIKKSGWVYTGQGREAAQMRWVQLINAKGGDACFASGVGTL